MSQAQQKTAPPQNRPIESAPVQPTASATQVSPENTWEPYLDLMKNWQRADAASTKARERAESVRKEDVARSHSTFEAEKTRIESSHKERTNAIEAEQKAAKEKANSLLGQVRNIQGNVRRALETVDLDTLMDGVEVPAIAERGDAQNTQQALQNSVIRSQGLDEALQEDLFAIRAARQRQSAQMWAVGIGLWLVATVVFAPYALIMALLAGIAVFVMGTPRKIAMSEALRPSFGVHVGHCVALLCGKQQVMQHPFSLVEKGRSVSGNALGGALAAATITWVLFASWKQPAGYNLEFLVRHLTLMFFLCVASGALTFALANQHLTSPELSEGDTNKILR